MIFRRLSLFNLFSYRGHQTLDLVPAEGDKRNIVLVMGRNGYGKTSLLNAVKLLFLGTDDRTQRQVGFPPTGLGRSDYILGVDQKWAGIMNRAARASGEKECWIRVELGTTTETTFTAERRWTITEREYREFVKVEHETRVFTDEAADGRLAEILPRELVPFFFFDGEEVQFLAEASDMHRVEAMERLLSLSFITGVETELIGIIKGWRRSELPEEWRAKIADYEAKIQVSLAQADALSRKALGYESQQRELEDDAAGLKRRMAQLSRSGVMAQAEGLDDEIRELENSLQREQNEMAYAIAKDAPIFANPGLVRSAISPLKEAVDQKARASDDVLRTLSSVLPSRLFEEPPQPRPALSPEQRQFYTAKLNKLLEAFNLPASDGGRFSSVDLVRARQLLEQFLGFNSVLSDVRQERARRLREVSRRKTELEEKRALRRELEFGSSRTAEEYARFQSEHEETAKQLGRLHVEREKIQQQIEKHNQDVANAETAIRDLEREEHKASRASKRLEIAIALRESFAEYKRRRRESKRREIQDALNKNFKRLMSGHDLISNIEIDENFLLRFLDKTDQEIGRSTISHGMRQLAVTALLWALKDVSGKDLPVIVDTPLARIDRENQENLLSHYYPNAAPQVIVLATDSEIDHRKLRILSPHICRVIHLSNPHGESTSFIETDTAELIGEALADG